MCCAPGLGLLFALAVMAGAARADTAALVASQCMACHGDGGNSVVPMFPRLAGQQAQYVAKQLRDFLTGKRKNEVMAPSLAQFKDADVDGLAAYYAAQKRTPITPGNDKLLAAGKALYDDGNTQSGVPACVGCHQPEGLGNDRYPGLAGQHPGYAATQLQQFKSGARNNDRAKVMRAVAARMSNDEIAAVVEFLASLP
jgi:cytochrome c553